jgi:hypothetical protein
MWTLVGLTPLPTRVGEVGFGYRFVRWVLLDGNRWPVTLLVSGVVFVVFAGLSTAGVIGVTEKGLMTSVLGSSITGVFTLITVTTSINQLVLSRVLGSPDDIVSRTESVKEFRENIAEMNPRQDVSPIEPEEFLLQLNYVLEERTEQLDRAFQRRPTDETETVEELTLDVLELTQQTIDALDADDLGLFQTLSPILNDEYSIHIHTIRQLRESDSSLDSEQLEALDDLESTLISMNYTRHYLKTLYIQEALAKVSLYVFLTGVPSLLVGYLTILSYDSGPILSGLALSLGVSVVMVLVVLPLSILFAYLVRVASIAKRTTTFGTFTPPSEEA